MPFNIAVTQIDELSFMFIVIDIQLNAEQKCLENALYYKVVSLYNEQ